MKYFPVVLFVASISTLGVCDDLDIRNSPGIIQKSPSEVLLENIDTQLTYSRSLADFLSVAQVGLKPEGEPAVTQDEITNYQSKLVSTLPLIGKKISEAMNLSDESLKNNAIKKILRFISSLSQNNFNEKSKNQIWNKSIRQIFHQVGTQDFIIYSLKIMDPDTNKKPHRYEDVSNLEFAYAGLGIIIEAQLPSEEKVHWKEKFRTEGMRIEYVKSAGYFDELENEEEASVPDLRNNLGATYELFDPNGISFNPSGKDTITLDEVVKILNSVQSANYKISSEFDFPSKKADELLFNGMRELNFRNPFRIPASKEEKISFNRDIIRRLEKEHTNKLSQSLVRYESNDGLKEIAAKNGGKLHIIKLVRKLPKPANPEGEKHNNDRVDIVEYWSTATYYLIGNPEGKLLAIKYSTLVDDEDGAFGPLDFGIAFQFMEDIQKTDAKFFERYFNQTVNPYFTEEQVANSAVISKAKEVQTELLFEDDLEKFYTSQDGILGVPDAHSDVAPFDKVEKILSNPALDWIALELPLSCKADLEKYMQSNDEHFNAKDYPKLYKAQSNLRFKRMSLFFPKEETELFNFEKILSTARNNHKAVYLLDPDSKYLAAWGGGASDRVHFATRNYFWSMNTPPDGRGAIFGGALHFIAPRGASAFAFIRKRFPNRPLFKVSFWTKTQN